MKFPKQELDVDEYLRVIKDLLYDKSCQIFIDTNIISQLYRLNEKAREDFYKWVDFCGDRFHIPNWSVHEYSKRVTSKNTKDYLSELTKAKTYANEFNKISGFIKGYVGDSMLIGSVYAGKKEQLFSDIDSVNTQFSKIANAINKHLDEHQQSVHKEVLNRLEKYTIDSDIYTIMKNLDCVCDLRIDGKIPPGFQDSEKDDNRFGDLIIWKEILDFCEKNGLKEHKAKVVLISRDVKPDMVYRPVKQLRGGYVVKDDDKIEIAHESLVYEFKTVTQSEDFHLISFYSLVKILASKYRDLASSFQIATEQEIFVAEPESIEANSILECSSLTDENTVRASSEPTCMEPPHNAEPILEQTDLKYSPTAFADKDYNTDIGPSSINECIESLKTYNWYKQNPAIGKLTTQSFASFKDTQQNMDSFFVLGRNILQSAEGSSGSAISFVENIHYQIKNWPKPFQIAFTEGCLYEVFFDSSGCIRRKGFKASYFETLVDEIKKANLVEIFDFINKELLAKKGERFVPNVNSDEKYKYKYKFEIKKIRTDHDSPFFDTKTISLKINEIDVSETFENNFESMFAYSKNLKTALSAYYAIPVGNIDIVPFDDDIKIVNYIVPHE